MCHTHQPWSKFRRDYTFIQSRKWQSTPVFLPENSVERGVWQATVHAWRHKESDVTEQARVTTHLRWNPKNRLYRPSGSLEKIKNKTVKSLLHTLNGSNAHLIKVDSSWSHPLHLHSFLFPSVSKNKICFKWSPGAWKAGGPVCGFFGYEGTDAGKQIRKKSNRQNT